MRRVTWGAVGVVALLAAGCDAGDNDGGVFESGGTAGATAGSDGDDGPKSDDSDDEPEPEDDSGDDSDSGGEPADNDEVKEYIEEAKKEFPTYEDIHVKVIQRTCTPFENVCHNNKEYPDLRTPQGVIDRIGRPCNLNEVYNDPESVFNGCEPAGDFLRFTDGGNATLSFEIGYVDVTDDGMGGGSAAIVVKDALLASMTSAGVLESAQIERMVGGQMQTVGSLVGVLSYVPGSKTITVAASATFGDDASLLETDVTYGDPNRDGVFGASMDESMLEIAPGDPWNSYLLQRLQGNVPGSPMPLANQPLSASEVVAVACWIEGTADEGGAETDSIIDYDDCAYAAELVAPPDGGGATLSGHIQPIFDQSCAFAGCHSTNNPAAGLDLTAGNSRDALLEVMATQNPDVPLVTALNPTNSYLLTKLISAGTSGQQMPLGGESLSEGQLELVRTWILQGAPDN